MSFKEYFYGATNGEQEEGTIDKTKPLELVSKEESIHGMFENLSSKAGENSNSFKKTVHLKCDEIHDSSETVQNHLGLGGMMGNYKKVAVTLKKEEDTINVCIKRGKNRIVFAYGQSTQELISSIQTEDGKDPEGRKWKHLDALTKVYDDLYSIMVAVENNDLINGGGSL